MNDLGAQGNEGKGPFPDLLPWHQNSKQMIRTRYHHQTDWHAFNTFYNKIRLRHSSKTRLYGDILHIIGVSWDQIRLGLCCVECTCPRIVQRHTGSVNWKLKLSIGVIHLVCLWVSLVMDRWPVQGVPCLSGSWGAENGCVVLADRWTDSTIKWIQQRLRLCLGVVQPNPSCPACCMSRLEFTHTYLSAFSGRCQQNYVEINMKCLAWGGRLSPHFYIFIQRTRLSPTNELMKLFKNERVSPKWRGINLKTTLFSFIVQYNMLFHTKCTFWCSYNIMCQLAN